MSVLGAVVVVALTTILAGLAQYYKVLSEKLAGQVLVAHEWIDEIIKALENTDETEGNRTIDGLVAQRKPDERPGSA